MSQTPEMPLSAETLLRHEPFVRAVVRGLLSDEHGVQDVVQETWLRALKKPPQRHVPIRAWLARVAGNLARDRHRRTSRLQARERAAARAEGVESLDETYQRLAGQREVVTAVLELREPYRSVVLLRYYQDLTADEIAQRLERSAATVRSQLSRAHDVLRRALDARFGTRKEWAGLVLATPRGGSALAWMRNLVAARPLAAAAGALAFVGLAAVVLPSWLGAHGVGGAAASPLAAADPSTTPGGVHGLATTPGSPTTREPIGATAPAALGSGQQANLESRSLQELLELAVQIQRAAERILLTPEEHVASEHAALLSLPNTGTCRILSGSSTSSRYGRAITKRGGGSYYSFSRRDHSYDNEPDVSYHNGGFGAEFYGGQIGMLMEIGDVDLADLPESPGPAPADLPSSRHAAWESMWTDIPSDRAEQRAFREQLGDLRYQLVPSGTGTTILLRSFSAGEHDHLVAFRPVVLEDEACTLVFRILKTWPVPGKKRAQHDGAGEHREVPAGPDWLAESSLGELLQLLDLVRATANERLFAVPEELEQRYLAVVDQPASSFAQKFGFGRILSRGRFDPLVEMRGGGAYYSFLTRSNSYDETPELSLEHGRFHSGFAGRQDGLLLDLGEISFEHLGSVMSGEAPPHPTARQREAFEFLWNVRARVDEASKRRALDPADDQRATELGLRAHVPAIVGHTYLLRPVLFDTHDHLVVFTVIEGDESGQTLAWRILKSWSVEQPTRGR